MSEKNNVKTIKGEKDCKPDTVYNKILIEMARLVTFVLFLAIMSCILAAKGEFIDIRLYSKNKLKA